MMNISKKEKGFTLIELMIVVAIIGILAAIAIPQFSAYRTKAFNSAAVSDLHTARLAEEALFADYQTYGSSVATNAKSTSGGVKLVKSGWVATTVTTAVQSSPIGISNHVELQAATDATGAYAGITAQHTKGDKSYGAETDQSGTFQKPVASVGTFEAPPSTYTNAQDLATTYVVM
ncbi:MAG: prepilin-type N-terminal cleavage/methylation domain-containing protein [Mariprofundus sp.]|nr:prepilin-type N-terminal cleavage/methylation domain-containing protein [Mariprofundus sp.]